MILEKRNTGTYGNVVYLSDGRTELAAALDYGLRVVHLSCAGRENVLYRQEPGCPDGVTTDKGWRLYGGHRFWSAPESESSYYPDNEPVECDLLEGGVRLRQRVDPWTKLQKELTLHLLPDGTVQAEHVLTNCGDAPVSAAPWGITTLRGGGTARIPFSPTVTGEMNPRRVLALWGGTRMDDPRLRFGPEALEVRWDGGSGDYCKLGLYNSTGTASYTVGGQRFTLTFPVAPPEVCPDMGCNTEVFVNRRFLELESLGPTQTLAPGESARHTEHWRMETV